MLTTPAHIPSTVYATILPNCVVDSSTVIDGHRGLPPRRPVDSFIRPLQGHPKESKPTRPQPCSRAKLHDLSPLCTVPTIRLLFRPASPATAVRCTLKCSRCCLGQIRSRDPGAGIEWNQRRVLITNMLSSPWPFFLSLTLTPKQLHDHLLPSQSPTPICFSPPRSPA